MKIKDPLQPVRENCILLARAETHNGALDWFNVPIVELAEWAEAVNQLEKHNKAHRKK